MENSYVAAVDLGTTKVIIAVAKRAEKGKVEIVAVREHASKGVIKGDLKNNEQAFDALSTVKNQIEEELGIRISEVYIGISGQHIECAKATGGIFVKSSDRSVSEVTAEDVDRLISEMYKSDLPLEKSIISVLPQTYKVDDEEEITEPVGMEGKRLDADFNVIIGKVAAIDRIKRCFVRAKMDVLGIMLQPLASSYAVLSEDEKELGVAVVDIGGGTTDLCIYHDKIIRHIAVLPVGGSDVNKDIKSYGILDRHLENLKTLYGEAVADKAPTQVYVKITAANGQNAKQVSVRSLAGIIEPRMYDIIDFVGDQIEKAGYKLGAGIVLTGGGSNLKNLDMLFRNRLGRNVRLASPTQYLTDESLEKVNSPKYSTIAGLLIDGVRSGKFTKIEKLPEEEKSKEMDVRVEDVNNYPQKHPTREQILEAQRRAYEAGQRAEREDLERQRENDNLGGGAGIPGGGNEGGEDDITKPGEPRGPEGPGEPGEPGPEGPREPGPEEPEGPGIEVVRPPKNGFFTRLGKGLGKLFNPDDVDAEDEYDDRI